jgi:hypothetical protein
MLCITIVCYFFVAGYTLPLRDYVTFAVSVLQLASVWVVLSSLGLLSDEDDRNIVLSVFLGEQVHTLLLVIDPGVHCWVTEYKPLPLQ